MIENQIEAANQICRNKPNINRRCDWQQHLFCPAVETDLKHIRKLVHLKHRSGNTDLTQHRQTAECRLSERNRAECNQGRQRKFLCHADALQVLIVNDIVLRCGADRTTDAVAIRFQIVEGSICRFFALAVRVQSRPLELSVAGKHLRFQTEDTDHAALSLRNRIDLTGIAHSFGDEFSASLFWNRDKMFLKGVVINVREIDIVELHAAQFLELFLDAAAHFERKLEDLFKLFLRELPVRIKQLDHATNHLADGNRVALIKVLAEAEILVQRIAVLLLAKLPDELCQIVSDEAIAYGEGRNGKSTFWNTLSRVLGTYSGNMSADTLTVGCKRNVKPELAEAKGKRIIIAAELEEGMRLNTSNVKQLCSTDEIYAEKKYKDPFSFVPSHTLVLYTNHLPKVGAIDAGTWRRLIVIPFNAKIEGSSDIKNYADYLFNKAGSAILKWIMTGAKRVIEKDYHIVKPAVVEAAIQKYKDNNDWLSQFLDECCEIDSSYSAKSGDVYNAYRSYCMQVGDYIRSTTDFYTALECAGFERKRSKSARLLFGLQLKSDFLD